MTLRHYGKSRKLKYGKYKKEEFQLERGTLEPSMLIGTGLARWRNACAKKPLVKFCHSKGGPGGTVQLTPLRAGSSRREHLHESVAESSLQMVALMSKNQITPTGKSGSAESG